jgi:hypothetical protein
MLRDREDVARLEKVLATMKVGRRPVDSLDACIRARRCVCCKSKRLTAASQCRFAGLKQAHHQPFSTSFRACDPP